MHCKIADLLVEVPEAGGLAPRCRDYLIDEETDFQPDIVIREAEFDPSWYPVELTYQQLSYVEAGRLFNKYLLYHNGLVIHASAVEYQGRVYLFSAPSGTGKSTHTGLWQQVLGPEARIINDDKPTLRLIDGTWYAYGTPWSGSGSNINRKAPLAGVCFLRRADENTIRRLSLEEATIRMIWQTMKLHETDLMTKKLATINQFLQAIPVFELENNMAPECAHLSYETMRKAAEEAGL